jgi:hypothetical protein
MKTTKRTGWVILSAILLVPLFLMINNVFAANSTISQTKTPLDPLRDQLKVYEDELNSDKASEADKEIIRIKYASIAYEATQRAISLTNAKPSLPYRTATPAPPAVYREIPDGIDEYPIIPNRNAFPDDIFPANGWHKKMGDDGTLFVYAGCLMDDFSQGVVTMKEVGISLKFKKFLAPENSGQLRIVREDKMVLTLQNKTGQTFYFDVTKESFVDQNGNVVSGAKKIESTPTASVGYPHP